MTQHKYVLAIMAPLVFASLFLISKTAAENKTLSSAPYQYDLVESITLDGEDYNLRVFTPEDSQLQIRHFNDTLSRARHKRADVTLRGEITSCMGVIDLPVGTARGNHSYGGYCTLQTTDSGTQNVLICDDELVGHLNMAPHKETIETPMTLDQIRTLALFTKNNCYGG